MEGIANIDYLLLTHRHLDRVSEPLLQQDIFWYLIGLGLGREMLMVAFVGYGNYHCVLGVKKICKAKDMGEQACTLIGMPHYVTSKTCTTNQHVHHHPLSSSSGLHCRLSDHY